MTYLGGNPMIWLGLMILFAIIEACTLGVISIWFVIGAGVAMIISLCGVGFGIELTAFIVVSLLLVCFARQWAVSYLKVGHEKTNTERLIGQAAVITKIVEPHEYGELKINGVYWRCQSKSNTLYQEGDIVTIESIEGVTIMLD